MTHSELSDIHHSGAETMAQAAKAQRQQKVQAGKIRAVKRQARLDEPYTRHGYPNRNAYLADLADSSGVPIEAVEVLANILGRVEDFDGLVTALEDYSDY